MKPSSHTLMQWGLNLILMIIIFSLVWVWVFGPVQYQRHLENQKLKILYANTAFNNCEWIPNRILETGRYPVRCEVNAKQMVWLAVDETTHIVGRLNVDKVKLESDMQTLRSRYATSDIQFSFLQDRFVYDVKTNEGEVVLGLDDLMPIVKVDW